nr:hypothetical protein [Tanacetum cinerariifolium]GEZ97937.1 hypothetical protein [Tanacetum cinerariifolium]
MDLFSLISASNTAKVKTRTRPCAAHEVPLLTATASRVIDMKDMVVASGSSGTPFDVEKSPLDFTDEDPPQVITKMGKEATTEVIPESSLEKEVVAMGPVVNKRRHKIGNKGAGANAPPKDVPAAKSVSDPDQLSCVEPQSYPERDIAQSSRETAIEVPTEHVPTPEATKESYSQDSRMRSEDQGDGGTNKKARSGIKSLRTVETKVHGLHNQEKNLETLLEAEFADLQVSNNQLSQQVSTLRAQVTSEERIKSAFEEFKKYEDDRVNSWCAEIDARLDELSIDFDEQLYPHMLTAIAVFTDVVSAGVTKGMSEGLKHGIEHGKANLDLATIEAYDPKADANYVAALHALKDLKYPLWIRELRPSSSQLKILVYPEVHDLKDPWSFKEEILLEDAIAANISRAKKKKNYRVVCRTHGVGFAHYARSDGVSVLMPTVAPQGLAILLSDADTQTEISKDEASPRLLRSKSLPPMYNLDCP